MASPREVEIPVTLVLDIPKAFGKTAMAEQIQAFVIEAMAQAWDEGDDARIDYMVARERYEASEGWLAIPQVPQNPYRNKQHPTNKKEN